MRKDSKGRPLFDEVMPTEELIKILTDNFDIFTGVPDSMFSGIIPLLKKYIPAPRENHAVSIAFGAALAGKKACVLMQNSGIGLCGDALLGLQRLHQTGVVLLITLRGELEWEEIQHHDWAKCTHKVLKAYDINSYDYGKLGKKALLAAGEDSNNGLISAVILHRGNIHEPS